MLVVVVLGHNHLAESITRDFAGDERTQLIRMSTMVEPDHEARRDEKAPDTVAMFLEQAAAAFSKGKRLLIVTGFPKNVTDAHYLGTRCPSILVLSLELPADSIVYKSIGHAHAGVPHSQLKQQIVREELETAHIKKVMKVGSDHVIYGIRCVSKQRRFLRNQIDKFLKSTMIRLELPVVHKIASTRHHALLTA